MTLMNCYQKIRSTLTKSIEYRILVLLASFTADPDLRVPNAIAVMDTVVLPMAKTVCNA